jgi:hypothetical protein
METETIRPAVTASGTMSMMKIGQRTSAISSSPKPMKEISLRRFSRLTKRLIAAP